VACWTGGARSPFSVFTFVLFNVSLLLLPLPRLALCLSFCSAGTYAVVCHRSAPYHSVIKRLINNHDVAYKAELT
jgi:hypothetical protein